MIIVFLCLFVLFPVSLVYGDTPSAENQLKQANEYIVKAIEFAKKDDIEGAKEQFELYKKQWFAIEEGIKDKSISSYKDIEDVMGRIAFALLQNPVQSQNVIKGLTEQADINQRFIDGNYAADDKTANNPSGNLTAVIALLKEAKQYLDQGNIEEAKASIEQFRGSWLDVEGIVLTQSAKAYADSERDMVLSYSYLSSSPAKTEEAKHTLNTMIDYLEPLALKTSYNMLDAVTILLREGLEALLVVVALLAFLKKSGHEDKKKWIWSGVSMGIAVSIVIGVIVQVLFSSGAFGNNNFMIAGFTGIFAAVMLLYMTYWLHSNASITQWNYYIKSRSTKALAKGSLWSLAILAFLAVFREGTETVLFLIGMASSINIVDLLAGVGIAVAILVVVSYLVLRVGVKIPIRPFFLVSSILVFYLCFKFTGMGVHGLQLAGFLPATDMNGITTIDALAIYPTWEGIIPQGLLIVAAGGIVVWNKVKDLRLQKQLEINNA
ncbi:FTR1 family iron permease [Cohnella sp. NL03-T5]|nr:FTR1 family iron permease [Cohnella silvisoli]